MRTLCLSFSCLWLWLCLHFSFRRLSSKKRKKQQQENSTIDGDVTDKSETTSTQSPFVTSSILDEDNRPENSVTSASTSLSTITSSSSSSFIPLFQQNNHPQTSHQIAIQQIGVVGQSPVLQGSGSQYIQLGTISHPQNNQSE